MNGKKRESDNLRRRSNCRDRARIRYDFIMRQRSRERRHAVRDNKCFPIIQPQNSYLEKGRNGRGWNDGGVAAGDAQWRVETAEGLV